jgi:hypothetical protein
MSKLIAEMQVGDQAGLDAVLKRDALNLASCKAHCQMIVRAVEALSAAPGESSNKCARDLLCRIIKDDAYGGFAELATYDWLARCHVEFEPQVKLAKSDVLGVNGSTLDGRLTFVPAFFEAKAFGFNGRMVQLLAERLQQEFETAQVLITESWTLSIDEFEKLMRNVKTLAEDLRLKRTIKIGHMRIELRRRQLVTITSHISDPYGLARENAEYAFRDAKQFTRNSPFLLIFVIHPWFTAGEMSNNLVGQTPTFFRAFARRSFMQFSNDKRPLRRICAKVPSGMTMADAAPLLTAMLFVNAWPMEASPGETVRKQQAWLYANPRAKNRMIPGDMALFQPEGGIPPHTEYFTNDDY